MKTFSKLKAGVAPAALGLALVAVPAFAQGAAPQAAAADEAPAQAIVVTGSRISNPNLTSISPVTVVGAAEVKNQGNVRVEDLLNSLPQVFASEGSTDSNGASGIATVDLRDLGPQRTLVLINGRRLGAGDPTDPVADLNFIPGSLIQRVDILTGGASATYGSDALSGVVNFILNKDFEGVQVDAQTSFYNHNNNYNNNANYNGALARRGYNPPKGQTTDGAAQNLTLTVGGSLADGKGHVTLYAGYRKVNPVTQGDRDYSYCGYTAGSSGSCGGSSTSASGRFRKTVPTVLKTATTYAPTGSSFTLDPAAPGTFRTYSSTRDGFNFNPYNYFQRPDERYTFGGFAHYEINEHFDPYLEVMFMDDHTRAQIAPSGAFFGTDFFLTCNNPLASASQLSSLCGANAGTSAVQSIYLGRRNLEGGPRVDDLRHTDYRIVAGMKGEISDAITYDVYGQFYRALLTERYENDFSRVKINRSLQVVTGPNGNAVCASAIPNAQGIIIDANCVPWNVFTPGGVTQSAVNYLQTPGFKQGASTEYIASGTVSIDFGKFGAKLPWTDDGIQAAFGAEYRHEVLDITNDAEFQTGDLAGQGTPFGVRDVHGSYTVKEGFGEVSVPIVKNKPGFETLGFTGGYRYSSYNLTGSTNTYKFQLEYAPIRQVRFRGGYNRAVRAPNNLELFSTPNIALFAGRDPCAGAKPSATLAQCMLTGVSAAQYGTIDANPANQNNQQTAGNVGLKPEIGDTYTVGVVINPIRNASLTVDFYDIRVKQAIGTVGALTILNNCIASGNPLFCNNISRATGSGTLWTGNGFVANPTLNLGSIKTRGIDISANYRFDLPHGSSLNFDLVGTYLDKYLVQQGVGVLDVGTYNCAGLFGSSCGTPLPKWRSKLRMTYAMKNGISVSTAWRYFNHVDNAFNSTNALIGTGPGSVAPEVARIPSVNYFDLSLSARIGNNYTFRLGAQNILDKTPPVLDGNYSNNGSNTYAQVYDSLGRYVYAAIQLNF